MLARGIENQGNDRDRIDIKAWYHSFRDALSGKHRRAFRVTFECNAFQRLDPSHICGVYAYIMTAGTFELDDAAPILDQLYADIWGTAYVDAGLDVLRRYVEEDLKERSEERELFVLDSLAPDFMAWT
jgi:hypothetical protein